MSPAYQAHPDIPVDILHGSARLLCHSLVFTPETWEGASDDPLKQCDFENASGAVDPSTLFLFDVDARMNTQTVLTFADRCRYDLGGLLPERS